MMTTGSRPRPSVAPGASSTGRCSATDETREGAARELLMRAGVSGDKGSRGAPAVADPREREVERARFVTDASHSPRLGAPDRARGRNADNMARLAGDP